MRRRQYLLRGVATTAGLCGTVGCLGLLGGPPDPKLQSLDVEEGVVEFDNRGGRGRIHLFLQFRDDAGTLIGQEHHEGNFRSGNNRWHILIRPPVCTAETTASFYGGSFDGTPNPTDVRGRTHTCQRETDGGETKTDYAALVQCRNSGAGGTLEASVTVRFPDRVDLQMGSVKFDAPPNGTAIWRDTFTEKPSTVEATVDPA